MSTRISSEDLLALYHSRKQLAVTRGAKWITSTMLVPPISTLPLLLMTRFSRQMLWGAILASCGFWFFGVMMLVFYLISPLKTSREKWESYKIVMSTGYDGVLLLFFSLISISMSILSIRDAEIRFPELVTALILVLYLTVSAIPLVRTRSIVRQLQDGYSKTPMREELKLSSRIQSGIIIAIVIVAYLVSNSPRLGALATFGLTAFGGLMLAPFGALGIVECVWLLIGLRDYSKAL